MCVTLGKNDIILLWHRPYFLICYKELIFFQVHPATVGGSGGSATVHTMAVDEGHVLNIDAASAGIASIDLSFQLEYSISNKSKSLVILTC